MSLKTVFECIQVQQVRGRAPKAPTLWRSQFALPSGWRWLGGEGGADARGGALRGARGPRARARERDRPGREAPARCGGASATPTPPHPPARSACLNFRSDGFKKHLSSRSVSSRRSAHGRPQPHALPRGQGAPRAAHALREAPAQGPGRVEAREGRGHRAWCIFVRYT